MKRYKIFFKCPDCNGTEITEHLATDSTDSVLKPVITVGRPTDDGEDHVEFDYRATKVTGEIYDVTYHCESCGKLVGEQTDWTQYSGSCPDEGCSGGVVNGQCDQCGDNYELKLGGVEGALLQWLKDNDMIEELNENWAPIPEVGDSCPNLDSCSGVLGKNEDGIACPQCGLSWAEDE